MLKPRHWLLAVAAAVPCLLLADDSAGPGPGAEPRNVEVVWQGMRRPAPEPVILERPLRLEFEINQGETHRFDVMCASEDYRISIDMGNQDGENQLQMSGSLRPLDDAEQVFLTFEVSIHHADLNEGGEVTFAAEGSTIVSLGERARLASFPGPVVSVTVSPVE